MRRVVMWVESGTDQSSQMGVMVSVCMSVCIQSGRRSREWQCGIIGAISSKHGKWINRDRLMVCSIDGWHLVAVAEEAATAEQREAMRHRGSLSRCISLLTCMVTDTTTCNAIKASLAYSPALSHTSTRQ
jgi:hypothetical protein